MALFKGATLIVTIPNKDSVIIDKYRGELAKVWTVTPFEVIPIGRIKQYSNKPNYAFATIGGLTYNMGAGNDRFGNDRAVANFQYFYEVWMPVPKKMMNVKERIIFGRIMLEADVRSKVKAPTYNEMSWGRIRFGEGPVMSIYETAEFTNFGYGFLKGFFKVINDGIAAGEVISHSKLEVSKQNRKLLEQLNADTLYVLNAVKGSVYMPEDMKARVSEKDIENVEAKTDDDKDDVNVKFPYVVKYIEQDELNEKIRTSGKSVFYFNYLSTGVGKFANVFEGQSGNIVYHRSDLLFAAYKSYEFYLRKIAKDVK
ncbi:MAG: hypothetical protein JNL13_06520 [Chitinophagaceae bacterium]|nr:hypothetical protein [Chitinophagaceae bacterium]